MRYSGRYKLLKRIFLGCAVCTIGALGVIAVVSSPGCSKGEAKLPESIREKIRDSERASAAAARRDLPIATIPSDGITTRFTVRPFDDWTMREAAAVALSRIGEAAVPALVEGLRSPDAAMRQQSADTLARIGPSAAKAVPALVELLEDSDPRVRKSAARALGQVGPAAAEAVPSLIRALETPPTPAERQAEEELN